MLSLYQDAVKIRQSPRQAVRHQASEMSPEQFFEIRSMEELTAEEKYNASFPHRHGLFEILFITAGTGVYQVGVEEFPFSQDHILYIFPGKTHLTKFDADARGYILSFSLEFLQMSVERSLLLNSSSCLAVSDSGLVQLDAETKAEMGEVVRKMQREYRLAGDYRMEALQRLLKIFLIQLSRLPIEIGEPEFSRNNAIIKKFMDVLEEKFMTMRMPGDYAEMLCITTSYLNDVVKKTSGYTTSHHIRQRILLEVKRHILYSNSSMKQIAYRLGFDDLAHFSKFFKKSAGECFRDFKRKALVSTVDSPLWG